jgi:hypothetical protein
MKLFSSLDFAKIKPDEQSLIGVGLLFKMIPDYTAHYICLKNDFFLFTLDLLAWLVEISYISVQKLYLGWHMVRIYKSISVTLHLET